ncbi:hypothetical protein SeMB42_g05778 [Synchytrium endobioticum]|uniref:Structural maintenance of chromosomes protein n=1 Tax=Synchytrium endobioticum TaxID=286115 RepID=A0A507CPE9_9FUNG|nr:hypothetical protein SeMB42_g05778 [Synchytrium endobioticum]TPX49090.1 hypothetical protein SeLEV6574_g01685 [Synchytrium endobioticum]
MYIKQIVIQGFKSYKDQIVIDSFSPKHNVVVGRNGSGKSNFFLAIRFVLGDAYHSMTREERQQLLHEGTGPTTMTAYVEITFDNSDNRFPTGKDDTVLRRTIGLKKDEYSLDKKSVTKQDVNNLLEAAGFSRSNPYYIVPQGRITTLTNAKDVERLQLLKDVAGTRVYEQRRQESVKIMEETDGKRAKIDELLEYIQERLTELETEKQELVQFQEKDRERRCLEYAIYQRDQMEVHKQLEELENARRADAEGIFERQTAFSDREKLITNIENEIRALRTRMNELKVEKQALDDDLQDYVRSHEHTRLALDEMVENAQHGVDQKKRVSYELKTLEAQIQVKQRTLDDILPRVERAIKDEQEMREELEALLLERDALFAKQGRNAKFKTQTERDAYLNEEIRAIKKTVNDQNKQIKDFEQDKAEAATALETLAEAIRVAKERMEDASRNEARFNADVENVRTTLSNLEDQKKTLWRDQAKAAEEFDRCQSEMQKSDRALTSTMPRETADGIKAIKQIVDRMGVRGVYGPIYQLFDVDEKYRVAVEEVAGNSLFHVVVDSENTAQILLEALTKERSGRVTFIPLSRVRAKAQAYPDSKDAIPMIKKLQFQPALQKAFMNIFGKAIIVPNLETGAKYAKSHSLQAVTMDGDSANRKGALTGGWHDTRRSRLAAAVAVREWRDKFRAADERQIRIEEGIARVDRELIRQQDELARLEVQRAQMLNASQMCGREIYEKNEEIESTERSITRMERSIHELTVSIRNLATQREVYEKELQTPLNRNLTTEETRRLEKCISESEKLSQEVDARFIEKCKLETQKVPIEVDLKNDMKQLENLKKRLLRLNVESDIGRIVGAKRTELENLEKKIADTQSNLYDMDQEIDEIGTQIDEKTTEYEKARTLQTEDHKTLERTQRSLNKYLATKAVLLKRKEECTKNIRDLGVLPEEAFEKYRDASPSRLVKRLHKINEELKKFAHVNKKALEQYNSFTRQRESLDKRKDELDTSSSSIQDLIKKLDQRKDEAIERTFTQVAKYFSDVWEKLVSAGRGNLVMLRSDDENDAMDEDEEDRQTKTIDSYIGVAINVSFNSKNDEGLRMNQLSGGQKSLVALALIFAIQRCDPAPFYLFDEIDAALDAQYRTAVANMVHELSETAQFVTTTFRPELLVHADKFYGVTFTSKIAPLFQVILYSPISRQCPVTHLPDPMDSHMDYTITSKHMPSSYASQPGTSSHGANTCSNRRKAVPFFLTLFLFSELVPLLVHYYPHMVPDVCIPAEWAAARRARRAGTRRRIARAFTAQVVREGRLSPRAFTSPAFIHRLAARQGQCFLLDNMGAPEVQLFGAYMGFEGLPTWWLRRVVGAHYAELLRDDEVLAREGICGLERAELSAAVEERGLPSDGLDYETMQEFLHQWIAIRVTAKPKINDNQNSLDDEYRCDVPIGLLWYMTMFRVALSEGPE